MQEAKITILKGKDNSARHSIPYPPAGLQTGTHRDTAQGDDCYTLLIKILPGFPCSTKTAPLLHPQPAYATLT